MLRNLLVAASRSLARDRLHAIISLLGLAAGFAAVLMIAAFCRHEYRFERFIDGYEDVYRLSAASKRAVRGSDATDDLRAPIAARLRTSFPEIAAVAELRNTFGNVSLRRGTVESLEPGFTWADPEVFEVLRFPVVAGDLRDALARPDGLVMTRRMARKYFGQDRPLGQTLEVAGEYLLRVSAVIEDLPSSTHLNTEIFGSTRALPPDPPGRVYRAHVYLRLTHGASADAVRARLPAFLDSLGTPTAGGKTSDQLELPLVPIADIHLRPAGALAMKPAGDPRFVRAMALTGALILLIVGINFVNLATARAAQRATEVGVRKAAGATRAQLALQFLGESTAAVTVAMLLALALAEWLLPHVGAQLDRQLAIDYGDLRVLAALLALVLGFGLAAGLYPALVLSSFSPTAVLRASSRTTGRGSLRQALVLAQFALLTGLAIVTGVVREQTRFGLSQGLRFDRSQLLIVGVPPVGCESSSFRNAVNALPGVVGSACENDFLGNYGTQPFRTPDGRELTLQNSGVGAGLFELLGLQPLAGRFFDAARESDQLPADAARRRLDTAWPTVVNETAARALGFAAPAAAIDQVITLAGAATPGLRRVIIGVVPDFARDAVRSPISPMIYDYSDFMVQLDVRLRPDRVPETLAAIDRLWKEHAPRPAPISRRFYDQVVQALYEDSTRQARLFGALSTLALLLAGVGLLALAAYAAERRTREIGLRKALGASTPDVMRLLLWQFARPVLAGSLIAWPVAAGLMARWLQGFAYHVPLPLWLFPLAALAALLVMFVTVAGHALRASRIRPSLALRYE